jgi:hypothetical protein
MNTWDELHTRKMYLSNLQNIPDMVLYADAWRLLAVDYLAIGATANADYCQARANHYGQLAGGEYIRLIEGQIAELIIVEAQ